MKNFKYDGFKVFETDSIWKCMQKPPNPNKKESKNTFCFVKREALVISRKEQRRFLILSSMGRAQITPIIVENKITKEQTDMIDLEACAVDSTKESVKLCTFKVFLEESS